MDNYTKATLMTERIIELIGEVKRIVENKRTFYTLEELADNIETEACNLLDLITDLDYERDGEKRNNQNVVDDIRKILKGLEGKLEEFE